MSAYDTARQVVDDAIRQRVFPAATIDVGRSSGSMWSDALGALTFERDAPAAAIDTPFDLASLTKPIATTTVVMELVRTGALRLDEPVSVSSTDWRGADRAAVTIRDLLEHASGLPARLVDAPPDTRREFEHEIGAMPLEYAPRSASIYSDLGFILLGFIVADRGGMSLADQFAQITIRAEGGHCLRVDARSTDARGADPADGRRHAPWTPARRRGSRQLRRGARRRRRPCGTLRHGDSGWVVRACVAAGRARRR